MGNGVVADFVGRFHSPDVDGREPVTGRILLSRSQLVLAHDEWKTNVSLTSVLDVNVGSVPPNLSQFFRDTVTIAYEDGNARRVAIVESESDTIDRFRGVLFKALLQDQTVKVKHPAKVGGRVTDASVRTAKLKLSSGRLGVATTSDRIDIDLSTVMEFSREQRTMGDSRYPVLAVTHMPARSATTTHITLPNDRLLNLLGRYLKLEYDEALEELEDISVSPDETEILVSLYSAGGTAPLREIITGDAARVQLITNGLVEKGLVVDGDEGFSLTPKGRIVASDRLESVNT